MWCIGDAQVNAQVVHRSCTYAEVMHRCKGAEVLQRRCDLLPCSLALLLLQADHQKALAEAQLSIEAAESSYADSTAPLHATAHLHADEVGFGVSSTGLVDAVATQVGFGRVGSDAGCVLVCYYTCWCTCSAYSLGMLACAHASVVRSHMWLRPLRLFLCRSHLLSNSPSCVCPLSTASQHRATPCTTMFAAYYRAVGGGRSAHRRAFLGGDSLVRWSRD